MEGPLHLFSLLHLKAPSSLLSFIINLCMQRPSNNPHWGRGCNFARHLTYSSILTVPPEQAIVSLILLPLHDSINRSDWPHIVPTFKTGCLHWNIHYRQWNTLLLFTIPILTICRTPRLVLSYSDIFLQLVMTVLNAFNFFQLYKELKRCFTLTVLFCGDMFK